ncbi:hypothetical protein OHV05_24855 [Kitasatospora sp. NBC_00070]|uniref:hypothetical protein n=1 Tax=Kitasatospora sp. NBC_00070 TaxID=2975962 RepID=UPI00324EDBCD
MSVLPEWMYPPREEGWCAEDLDSLTEAPPHTELIDGALIFMMSPQRAWHGRVVTALTVTLDAMAPQGVSVEREDGLPVVHVYELDVPTGGYVATGIFRGELTRPVPFPVTLDLAALLTGRRPD